MKNILKIPALVLGGILSAPLLTGCVPTPTPYATPVSLNFRLPGNDTSPQLQIAAIYWEAQADGSNTLKVLPGSYGYVSGSTAGISLSPYNLKELADKLKCTSPFVGGETTGMTAVTVTPDTVKTCNIYFTVYQDANGDGQPSVAEEKYMTHDMYSYASSDFTYSMTTPDGKSTESGTRRSGWTVVRHTVLQPATTPNKYLVSMNSVPTADEIIPIQLHEPTNFMTSMSVPGTSGGQP